MTLPYSLLLLALGLTGGTLSGLLGIGGGLVIVPLLLYAPLWLGFSPIDIRTATAVAVVQVTAATLSGTLAHRRRGAVYLRLAVTMSLASAAGALLGGVVSASVPSEMLLYATASLATVAALLMFLPTRTEAPDAGDQPPFSPVVVCVAGFVIGLVIGMNGSGAFLMMPALIYLVGLPTRTALGTVLAVGFPTSLAASIGKIATGQVPLILAGIVVVGAVIGAQIGSTLSARTPSRVLRWLYGALVSIIAVGLWWDIVNVR
ncbi:MAG: sulfite exporter TauE/SafE family protein [Chloroflexota bacterium]